jgi:hypothetical protein
MVKKSKLENIALGFEIESFFSPVSSGLHKSRSQLRTRGLFPVALLLADCTGVLFRVALLLAEPSLGLFPVALLLADCTGVLFRVALLLAEPSLGLAFGIITCRQQTRVNSNCIINDIMLIHINMVFLQYHIILFNRGSSDSRIREASYISGIPAPGRYSARCSIVIFKQAVGTSPSVKPLNFRLRVCDSDM